MKLKKKTIEEGPPRSESIVLLGLPLCLVLGLVSGYGPILILRYFIERLSFVVEG